MTMLAILPGQPAKGERQPAASAQDYPNLAPAQRDKLLAALAKRQPPKAETLPGCVKTEVPLMFCSVRSFASWRAVLSDNMTRVFQIWSELILKQLLLPLQ